MVKGHEFAQVQDSGRKMLVCMWLYSNQYILVDEVAYKGSKKKLVQELDSQRGEVAYFREKMVYTIVS